MFEFLSSQGRLLLQYRVREYSECCRHLGEDFLQRPLTFTATRVVAHCSQGRFYILGPEDLRR